MNLNMLIKELKYKLFIQFFRLKIKSLIIILNNLMINATILSNLIK